MGQKKSEAQKTLGPVKYQIRNLKNVVFPVPYFNDEGKLASLNLLIQGRGGATPPVILSTAVTDQMRDLERKGFIKLEQVD